MTTLRQHFIESLHAQGVSQHTQEEYVRADSQLTQFSQGQTGLPARLQFLEQSQGLVQPFFSLRIIARQPVQHAPGTMGNSQIECMVVTNGRFLCQRRILFQPFYLMLACSSIRQQCKHRMVANPIHLLFEGFFQMLFNQSELALCRQRQA